MCYEGPIYPSNQTCIQYVYAYSTCLISSILDMWMCLPDITVDPSMNSCELQNLRSGSTYCLLLSAYTAAGEGKRSGSMCFDTLSKFFHTNT